MTNIIKSNWLLVLILVLAAFFRFFWINELPGGLFPDEAANGLDVNLILEGQIEPFYERGNGREGLFFYFLALAVAVFGRGHWQHHMVSAGFGLVEVLVTYFLTKRLFNKRVALLAAFFMAASSFAVALSRTAFRANTVPLLTALTLLFLVKFLQSRQTKEKAVSMSLAGIFFGLGFYTYISFRMMIPLVLVMGVVFWSKFKKFIPRFAAGFALAFAWIGYYFWTHAGTFVGRAGQVSIFSKDLNQGDVIGTFLLVLKKTIFGFFTAGDLNWRHNIAGEPFLSPFLSPFFAASLLLFSYWLFRSPKKHWPMALLAAWFWLMLVPEITTAEGIPHGLRLVGVIPSIFILAAWGVDWLWLRIKKYKYLLPQTKYVYPGIFLSAVLVYNFLLYFGVAANSPDYYYAFRSDLTTVSKYLNQRNRKSQTYLVLDKFSVQTTDYLTTKVQNPYVLVEPGDAARIRLKNGDQVIFTMSSLGSRPNFLLKNSGVKLIKLKKNKFGQPIMMVYEQL